MDNIDAVYFGEIVKNYLDAFDKLNVYSVGDGKIQTLYNPRVITVKKGIYEIARLAGTEVFEHEFEFEGAPIFTYTVQVCGISFHQSSREKIEPSADQADDSRP